MTTDAQGETVIDALVAVANNRRLTDANRAKMIRDLIVQTRAIRVHAGTTWFHHPHYRDAIINDRTKARA